MCTIAKLKRHSKIFHDLFPTHRFPSLFISTLEPDGNHTVQVIDVKLVNVLVRRRKAQEFWVHNQLVQLEAKCRRHCHYEDKADHASTACDKCCFALVSELDTLTKQVKTFYPLTNFPQHSSHAFFLESIIILNFQESNY